MAGTLTRLTGAPPGGHEDTGQKTYPVEIRDGEVFIGLEPEPEHTRTVTDVMAETHGELGGAFGSLAWSGIPTLALRMRSGGEPWMRGYDALCRHSP